MRGLRSPIRRCLAHTLPMVLACALLAPARGQATPASPLTLDATVRTLQESFAGRRLAEHLACFDPANAEPRTRRERELLRIFATPVRGVRFQARDHRAVAGGIEATLVMAWRAHTVIGEEPEGDVRRVVFRQREGRWVVTEMDAEWRSGFEIAHHDAQVRIEPEKHSIEVTDMATLRLAPGRRGPLYLYLLPDLALSSVTCAGREAHFSRVDGVLAVELPGGRDNGTARVQFHYSGTVPRGRYAIIRVEPDSAFALRTWYWLPSVPRMRSAAQVCLDVPEGWLGVSAGGESTEPAGEGRRRFLWDTPLSSPYLSFCAAPYIRVSDASSGPECLAYVFPEHAASADAWVERVGGVLQFFADRLGPYRFPKFAIVEIRELPGAHASQSTIELPQAYFAEPPTPERLGAIAHELAHQWFPYVAGAAPRAYMFLAEGLAEYASWLYLEETRGGNARASEASFLRLAHEGRDLPLLDCPLDGAYYHKAAMVHHMLRGLLGDERFLGMLRSFCERNAGRNVGPEAYRAAAERAYGRRLDWFFRQWVSGRGVPTLSLAEVAATREGDRWRVPGVLRQAAETPFRLPVSLRLEYEGGSDTRTLWISKGEARFVLTCAGEPIRLVVDPGRDLLRLPEGEIQSPLGDPQSR